MLSYLLIKDYSDGIRFPDICLSIYLIYLSVCLSSDHDRMG